MPHRSRSICRAKSILNDTRYEGEVTLGAFDAEFIDLDATGA